MRVLQEEPVNQSEIPNESAEQDALPAPNAGPCCTTTALTECCESSAKLGCCGAVADSEPAPSQCGCKP